MEEYKVHTATTEKEFQEVLDKETLAGWTLHSWQDGSTEDCILYTIVLVRSQHED